MPVLAGLRVVQIGHGLAAGVCGRLLADVGASVSCLDPGASTALARHLNVAKPLIEGGTRVRDAIAAADFIVCEGSPQELRRHQCDGAALRAVNPSATLVFISPFGQIGPRADDPASDLTLSFSSGIARMLTGQVDDLDEAPIRPVGDQSAFIGGIAAACAGMHAAMAPEPAVVDVSIEEALATIAITELARAGNGAASWSRKRLADGNGATVCILPARDGHVAISPRDDHQWHAWLQVMRSPAWGTDPRFITKRDRIANWDALYDLMCAWSRQCNKQWIADRAQRAHVPSFPLREPIEQLASPQLEHRGFWRPLDLAGHRIKAPGSPFGLRLQSTPPAAPRAAAPDSAAAMPLAGVRVLDFSWVIAGPTATRYLAAMGADVIKVEAPGRGDPGRASELHSVLGQAKRAIVLDLKKPEAIAVAKALAAESDVLIENFATGVMDRLGLGAKAVQEANPNLVYVSASGLGRTGPEARAVAYGTLLQCYAGFAGLNRHPERPPRVGLAWLDPMCGLLLAFVAAAALWQRRRSGRAARVDFSMLEALLWTMAEPLLAAQTGPPLAPAGNRCERCAPHGAYRCAGDDEWLSVAVTEDASWRALCAAVPSLATMTDLDLAGRIARAVEIDRLLADWARDRDVAATAATLRRAGIAAAALATSRDLVHDEHLKARSFWEAQVAGVLPGLPWQASFGRVTDPAPALGADTEAVLRDVLALSPADISRLRAAGAFG
jgi:crotonobetainyl-CoA:carnitine CoA-transferase CaiB-like acyl-CoA transferase